MKRMKHGVRGAIHEIIGFDSREKGLIDVGLLQSGRRIHHLAMSHQVYHGASNGRHERWIGVMHLSGKIFDSVTRNVKLRSMPEVRGYVPTEPERPDRTYCLCGARLAGLLHDLGHLPFSQASEKEVLQDGTTRNTMRNRSRRSKCSRPLQGVVAEIGKGQA